MSVDTWLFAFAFAFVNNPKLCLKRQNNLFDGGGFCNQQLGANKRQLCSFSGLAPLRLAVVAYSGGSGNLQSQYSLSTQQSFDHCSIIPPQGSLDVLNAAAFNLTVAHIDNYNTIVFAVHCRTAKYQRSTFVVFLMFADIVLVINDLLSGLFWLLPLLLFLLVKQIVCLYVYIFFSYSSWTIELAEQFCLINR